MAWTSPWRFRAVVLIVAVVAAYGNSLHLPFLFDDTGAVLNNPSIRQLGIAALSPPADGSATTGRPLVNVSLALNHALTGERVWSYHALNILIHALAALTLMGLVRRTLSTSIAGEVAVAAPAIAFFAALLWALHPLQTECVVCIAQRTESLCGLLYLLTLYAFIRGVGPGAPRRGWLALSVAACLAGMAAKEVMVTAPVMVLLYDRTFVAGRFAAALRVRRTYYVALGSTWLLLATLVGQAGGTRGVAAGFDLGVTAWTYLLTQCEALLLYLRLSFWPHPLILDYGADVITSLRDVIWPAVIVLALLGATAWALVRKPVLGFAGAWFFIVLAPSSSVLPLVTQTMAEHRMYLPLAALVTAGAVAMYRRFGDAGFRPLAVIALVFATLTVGRLHDYRDPVTIWRDTVAKRPTNARAHHNLGWALQQAGQPGRANASFARALALQPGYVSAHYNWGVALLAQGRLSDAIPHLDAAVRLAPAHVDARVNLANALVQAGHPAEAVPHYEQALAGGTSPDIHYNLGIALIAAGREADAMDHLEAAVRAGTQLPEAHFQIGRVAERSGDARTAEARFQETLRLAPDHAAAHARLGLLLARMNRFPAAAEHFRHVIHLKPEDADAHANLGNVLLLQGQGRAAIASYEEALRLRPADVRTRESIRVARETLSESLRETK